MRSPRSSPTCPACSRAASTRAPGPRSSGAPCTRAAPTTSSRPSGKVGGTLRMLDASVWEGVERLLEEVVHAVVAPYAVQAEVSSSRGCPRSSTTPRASTRSPPRSPGRAPTSRRPRSRSAARTSRGTSPTCPAPWPGSAPAPPGGPTYDLHRGDLVVDETAITVGARTLAGAVFTSAASAPSGLGGPARVGVGSADAAAACRRSRIGNTSREMPLGGADPVGRGSTVPCYVGRCRRRPRGI